MRMSVKLPAELRAELESAARRLGPTKSAFIRRALAAEIAHARAEAGPTPYEPGRDLFGKGRSGRRSLSATRARDQIANATRLARSQSRSTSGISPSTGYATADASSIS